MSEAETNELSGKKLFRTGFIKRILFFALSYAVYFGASLLQLFAGDFIPQESGQLDSVTAYDYIMPAIDSSVALITIASFCLAGYFACGKSKVKMLRFPMAFSIAYVFSSFFSFLLTALLSTPVLVSDKTDINLIELQTIGSAIANAAAAFLAFVYFDKEKDDDYFYYSDYYVENPSAYRSFRARVLSWRFSVFVVVILVVGGEALFAKLSRSALTALILSVPDDFLWVSYYIEVIADLISYGVCVLITWYFARNIRLTAKLVGIICFADYSVNCLSFINSSISNMFAQAGDHWLNTFFSTVFVGASSFIISFIKLVAILLLCHRLNKSQQD